MSRAPAALGRPGGRRRWPLSDQPGAGDRDRVWPDTDREVGGKRNAPARRGRSARRPKSWLNGFFCLAGARGRASRSLHGGGRKTDVPPANKIGRASRRERVGQYVKILVVAVSL